VSTPNFRPFEIHVTSTVTGTQPFDTTPASPLAKARAGRFFRLLSDANERPRGHMQRQIQECKTLTLSVGLVPAGIATRTSSELSISSSDTGTIGSCWVLLAEAKPNTARTFSSPSVDPTRLDTTFHALYYCNHASTLTALVTATCSTRSQCHPPRMGSQQEAEPSSIPVNTDLRSPHSPAATRLWAWTANDGGPSKLSLLLGVPWGGCMA
ncbi:hypothetical protein M405DRAFT_818179, partial [Rhizopogon salebrosus TDB-379]